MVYLLEDDESIRRFVIYALRQTGNFLMKMVCGCRYLTSIMRATWACTGIKKCGS